MDFNKDYEIKDHDIATILKHFIIGQFVRNNSLVDERYINDWDDCPFKFKMEPIGYLDDHSVKGLSHSAMKEMTIDMVKTFSTLHVISDNVELEPHTILYSKQTYSDVKDQYKLMMRLDLFKRNDNFFDEVVLPDYMNLNFFQLHQKVATDNLNIGSLTHLAYSENKSIYNYSVLNQRGTIEKMHPSFQDFKNLWWENNKEYFLQAG